MEHFGNSVDVLVVGGGTAGCIAAIQAARSGARTMLLEAGSQLGGTMTAGGVSYPGLFHAWGRQIIAGIGWELVLRAVELDDGILPDFSVVPEHHWQHQIQINGSLYAALAEEACLEAGVELCLYEFPVEGEQTPEGWQIMSAGKGLNREVRCRQLIDCTGGADVVGLLGFSRARETETQPGTLVFRIEGYDAAQLDADDIQSRYEAALANGTLRKGDLSNPNAPFMSFLASGGGSANHQFGADSSTSASHTRANIEGRRCALRLLRFVRSLPGCEHARLANMQPETAVRETWRIAGEAQITHADYTGGRVFDDAVCFAFYPIDLHTEEGVEPAPLSPGLVPTIPLRALVPFGSRNLLVAGRSVSSDRAANSALRVQASAMAMGQAAGAAAALAVRNGTTPLRVPTGELRAELHAHGAITPG